MNFAWRIWIIALVALSACAGSNTRRPNVLLIVLDACRADKFGTYGFTRPTTPNIDALARDPNAVIFRRHHVQGTWTKPSTASLFTGLFVHQHGVMRNFRRTAPEGPVVGSDRLGPNFKTLAEAFHEAGFRTFAAVDNVVIEARSGFGQGFDYYVQSDDYRIGERFGKFLAANDRPYFAYLHYLACHAPYVPWMRDAQYMRAYGFPYNERARRARGINFAKSGSPVARADLKALTGNDIRFVRLLYEANLRRVDRALIGPLLRGLRRLGAFDPTLIILTADHGEDLFDHNSHSHGPLWEVGTHVPFIVKFPKGRKPPELGATVDKLTRSIDVFPALMRVIGERSPPGLPGTAILSGEFGDFTLVERVPREQWGLVRNGYKLLRTPDTSRLFRLHDDPAEEHDLASAEPERVTSMTAFARRIFNTSIKPEAKSGEVTTRLSPATEERLRYLGYLK